MLRPRRGSEPNCKAIYIGSMHSTGWHTVDVNPSVAGIYGSVHMKALVHKLVSCSACVKTKGTMPPLAAHYSSAVPAAAIATLSHKLAEVNCCHE